MLLLAVLEIAFGAVREVGVLADEVPVQTVLPRLSRLALLEISGRTGVRGFVQHDRYGRIGLRPALTVLRDEQVDPADDRPRHVLVGGPTATP